MISRVGIVLRRWRRRFRRTALAAHLIGGGPAKGEAANPGLILLQIDGLSRRHMEAGMRRGKLPFLERLIRRRHFSLETFYSGMPSTTPAVQAEIFWGKRSAVPAFHFMRRATGKPIRMYQASAASEIEQSLTGNGRRSLIEGGHSYSNIYRAGASRSRYCAEDFTPDEIIRQLHPVKLLILAFVYAPKILRIAALALMEFGLAIFDFFRGLNARADFGKELKFVVTRVAVCSVLRELIRFRALLDIERGVRVIHATFLGYDEQAHRRGPGSAFAHYTLRGIDRTVRDIFGAAHGSDYRDYEVMIYSDHGQEHTEPFYRRYGRKLEEALEEVFLRGPLAGKILWRQPSPGPESIGFAINRYWSILGLRESLANSATPDLERNIVVTAMGPIGHIYVPLRPGENAMGAYAKKLVSTAGIPLVLLPGEGETVKAFNARGEWVLPEDRAEVFGAEHPFLAEVTEDTLALCHHPDSGDFVISGWDPGKRALSFTRENGAHGGPGREETRGFLLLPDRIRRWHKIHLPRTRERVRGEELREIALHFLGRDGERVEQVPEHPPVDPEGKTALRIMTYNIHSCWGVDGKFRPERIARVINAFDPDIVGVQEVDAHRPRSGKHHQAEVIAGHLRMTHVFQAMLEEEKEAYGIAVFSKYPFEVVKSGLLTERGRRREARGAIFLRVAPEGRKPFYFLTTHFGLRPRERMEQVDELLGADWLGSLVGDEPLIVCGDFNCGPRSRVFKRLQSQFQAVGRGKGKRWLRPGFPSVKPFMRLDHIFASDHFTVNHVEIPDTPTAVVASDHLPLCAELALPMEGDDA